MSSASGGSSGGIAANGGAGQAGAAGEPTSVPYECDDGTIVRTAQLCDEFVDCPDASDEGACSPGNQTICSAGPAVGPAYDSVNRCLRAEVPLGCYELIPPALSVPTQWGTDHCARRKRDGLLAWVPEPVWATDWTDCTEDEKALLDAAPRCD